MKILALLFALFTLQSFAQAQTGDTSNVAKDTINITKSIAKDTTNFTFDSLKCFDDYKMLFNKRGVSELNDGMYKIVVTFRLNGSCKAYEGKARIIKGKFQLPVYIKNEKGMYVTIKSTGRTFNKNYDGYNIPLENKVTNGVSPTYISNTDELIDIFIVGLLK